MGLGDMWSRTLVYFGIAEEDDWDDDHADVVTQEENERQSRRRDRHNVRRLPRSETAPEEPRT